VSGGLLGAILPFALGNALSPIPLLAMILILFTPRARSNGPVLLIGWLAGLSLVFTVVILASGLATAAAGPGATGGPLLPAVLGTLLLFLAVRQWRSRPRDGAAPTTPKWMAAIDRLGPLQCAGAGFGLAAVNPKCLLLTIAAAGAVAAFGLDPAGNLAAGAAFVALSSFTIAGVLLYYLAGGQSAAGSLDRAQGWLLANNNVVLCLLFLFFAVSQYAQALQAL
jgi:hypothetical protein